MRHIVTPILMSLLLTGCVGGSIPALNKSFLATAKAKPVAFANKKLMDSIPELDGPPIPIAIYSFTDKTGQRKPSSTTASFSTAVTQGADAYVIKTLTDTNHGRWFKPDERVGKIGRAHV